VELRRQWIGELNRRSLALHVRRKGMNGFLGFGVVVDLKEEGKRK